MAESPFSPNVATTNAAIIQITTTHNLSPASVTTALTTNSSFLMAASSAAVGDDNLSLTCSKKQAFAPADPALGGRGAEMGSKKANKEHDKMQVEELK
jgi:hypothetical protein